jgi:hypothetical protein
MDVRRRLEWRDLTLTLSLARRGDPQVAGRWQRSIAANPGSTCTQGRPCMATHHLERILGGTTPPTRFPLLTNERVRVRSARGATTSSYTPAWHASP